MSTRIHRFVRTCDIHRAPSTGQSGIQVVATDHPCVGPYPASRETRTLPGLDTIVALFEMQCSAAVEIENQDTVACNGRTYSVIIAQHWEPTNPRTDPFYALVLEEITS